MSFGVGANAITMMQFAAAASQIVAKRRFLRLGHASAGSSEAKSVVGYFCHGGYMPCVK